MCAFTACSTTTHGCRLTSWARTDARPMHSENRCGRLDAARARAARREPVARRKPSKPRKPSPLTNGLPLYSTEWNVGSSPRDPLHDRSFAAVYAANHRAVSRSAGVGLHLLNLQRYLRGEVLSQRAVSRRRARVRVRLAWRQAGARRKCPSPRRRANAPDRRRRGHESPRAQPTRAQPTDGPKRTRRRAGGHPPVRGARSPRASDASGRELVNRPLAGQPIIVSG